MKTLKKTLCLVLALVMVVGTLAFSASAADFDDVDQIKYTEAVKVLTAIKVIDGKDGNRYDPTGTLTREQGAAIVVRALLTRNTADGLPAAGTSFSDVSGWSTKYVNYAAGQHILDGVGGNKFNPAGELTGTAFAKMLLVAIGVEGEYTGANWATNVYLAAQKAKLADGIDGFNYEAAINRDQAAQMAYNAINYSLQGETGTYKVTKGSSTLYTGTDALVALVMYQANAGAELTLDTVNTGSVADSMYGLKRTESKDAFQRSTVTVTGNNKVKVVVSEDATLTYTNGTTAGKIASDLGGTKSSDKYTLNVWEDGVAGTTVTADRYMTKDANKIGDKGSLVQVYSTGTTGVYNVIVINTYVAKLAKGDITAAKTPKNADPEPAYITISGMKYETDEFKAEDVVLYTKAGSEIQNVQKADYISGSVSAVGAKNAYTKIDGVQYEKSANADSSVDTLAFTVSSTTNTFYFDNYGNIIYAAAGKAAAVDTDYVYVLREGSRAAKSNDGAGIFDSGATTAALAQVEVIDINTGAVSVKNIGIVKHTDGKYYFANANGSKGDTEVPDLPVTDRNAIYEYATLTNGDIVLVSKASETKVSIDKDKAEIATGKIADSKTKLTVVTLNKDKDGKVTSATSASYTGIANFVKVSNDKAAVEYSTDPNTLATRIVIVMDKVDQSKNYAVYAGEGETNADGTKLAFYVNGEVVEYFGDGVKPSDLTEKTIYDLTVTNGKVTKATPVTDTVKGEVSYVDTSYVLVGGKTVYLASSYTVVDAGNGYAKGTIDREDTISYVVNGDGKLVFAVIEAAE